MYHLVYKFKKEPSLEILNELFSHNVNPNDLYDYLYNLSLLHVRQPYETMKYLLDKGGDPNLINETGVHPIHFQKDFKTIRLLLDRGAIPNPKDIYDFTPLFWQKDPESIEYLLKYNPINNNYIYNSVNYKPDHYYNVMLIEGGYDPYSENNISVTPVFLQRDLKSLEILLDHCFINEIPNYDIVYETLLFKPIINNDIIDLLDENWEDMNHQNILGNTPLHVQHDLKCILKLLREGVDTTIENNVGITPYWYHMNKKNYIAALLIKNFEAANILIKNWRIYWFRKTYIPPKNYKKKLHFLNEFKLLPPSNCGIFPGGIEYQNALERFTNNDIFAI